MCLEKDDNQCKKTPGEVMPSVAQSLHEYFSWYSFLQILQLIFSLILLVFIDSMTLLSDALVEDCHFSMHYAAVLQ